MINEGSRAIAVDVGETQAAAALAPVRAKLSELTLGKEGEGFPYDAGNAKPRDAFVADLGSLARLGSQRLAGRGTGRRGPRVPARAACASGGDPGLAA